MISDSFQVQFVKYLSRLFREGDFSATYKYAFLNAIADICIEKPLEQKLVISLHEITEKMVELYWAQAKPFAGESSYLLQNHGRQSVIVTKIAELQKRGYSLGTLKLDANEHNKLISKVVPTIKAGPLWRLQILSESKEEFLFKRYKDTSDIQLKDGIQKCFQLYYDLVISLTRDRWQQKIRSIPKNFELVGHQGDLENFLFGTQRKSLKKAEVLFADIQKNECFYCGKQIIKTKAVDHFIPWSRYSNDLGHNFVLAHDTCNSKKSDLLAGEVYFEKWINQNIVLNKQTINEELSKYFLCDAERSYAIADWAYKNNTAKLWLPG